MDLTESQIKFLIGLTKLTQETGVAIKGCGCCGSPYLIEVSDQNKEYEKRLKDAHHREVKIDNRESGYACEAKGEYIAWVNPKDHKYNYYADDILPKDYLEKK